MRAHYIDTYELPPCSAYLHALLACRTRRASGCAYKLGPGDRINVTVFGQTELSGDIQTGRFYLDRTSGRLYFADDPLRRKVEVTVAAFAFESAASDVLIRNLTVEKYASVARKGGDPTERGEPKTGRRLTKHSC